jgi:hypothetical protein
MLKFPVRKPVLIATFFLASVSAQQAPKSPAPQATSPVKVNVLNVCTPSPEEQAQIKNAFAKAEARHGFARDFEISRGRTTQENAADSKFVRLRRDFASESPLMTAQYSMSADPTVTIETLVLRMRDPKEFHELALEDRVSTGAASPSAILGLETPVTRIRLERFSKGSIVLARCQGVDQSAYDPLFREATTIMGQYRKALGLRDTFKTDINWLGGAAPANATSSPGQKKPQ